jgi:hypothetical protein
VDWCELGAVRGAGLPGGERMNSDSDTAEIPDHELEEHRTTVLGEDER